MRRFASVVAITLALLRLAPAAYATAGDLDPAFGVGGKVMVDLTRKNDFPWTVAFQVEARSWLRA